MHHITELCIFAAAFVIAFAYGPSLAGLVRKALRNEAALTRHTAVLASNNEERAAQRLPAARD